MDKLYQRKSNLREKFWFYRIKNIKFEIPMAVHIGIMIFKNWMLWSLGKLCLSTEEHGLTTLKIIILFKSMIIFTKLIVIDCLPSLN